jgi:DNA topoisomerase II
MSDDSLLASEFDDVGASSDFEPAPKAVSNRGLRRYCRLADMVSSQKAKPAPKKAAAPKAKAAPKKPVQKTLKTTKPAAKRKKAVSDDENSDVEMRDMDNDSLHDDSLLDDTPPNAKRQKKEAAPKKPSGKPLQEIDNEGVGLDGSDDVPPPKPATNKSATDRYQEVRSCG